MIRIAIGAMPPLLGSIVRSALQPERDFMLVAPQASASWTSADADVLIVCRDRGTDMSIPIANLFTGEIPAIVSIDSQGRSAQILHLVAEDVALGAGADFGSAVRLAAGRRARTTN